MLSIQITANPSLDDVKKWVKGLEYAVLYDLREFWNDWAAPAVAEEIGRIFATEGYGTWPPLSPRYARYKARHYPGKRVLRRTDMYFKAATSKSTGNLFISEKDRMVWGVDLGYFATAFGFPYPAALEKGSTRGMPPRPVFKLAAKSQHLQNNLVAALKNYLGKKIERETIKHFGK